MSKGQLQSSEGFQLLSRPRLLYLVNVMMCFMTTGHWTDAGSNEVIWTNACLDLRPEEVWRSLFPTLLYPSHSSLLFLSHHPPACTRTHTHGWKEELRSGTSLESVNRQRRGVTWSREIHFMDLFLFHLSSGRRLNNQHDGQRSTRVFWDLYRTHLGFYMLTTDMN